MSSRTHARPQKPRKSNKKKASALPYEKLLRLAPKMKPSQAWYDETGDAFRPEG